MTLLAAALLLVACKSDEPSGSYYIQMLKPITGNAYVSVKYANETTDSLVFYSSSSWALAPYQSVAPWLTIDGQSTGSGPMEVKRKITMEPNTTGDVREAYYRISVTNTSEEAYTTFAVQQMATRVDGTLGNAPLVKQIDGSDGSSISISYDNFSRPTHISQKGTTTEIDMVINYQDIGGENNVVEATFNMAKQNFVYKDTTYSVSNLTAKGRFYDQRFAGMKNYVLMPRMFSNFETTSDASMHRQTSNGFDDYTPVKREGSYAAFSVDGYYNTSFENALMVNSLLGRFVTTYGVYYNGKYQLYADQKHTADSIAVVRQFSDTQRRYETYKLEYSSIDARRTSVDVNQLIEGVDQCDPFMLLSFFKLARQSSVISKATGRFNTYTVSAKTRQDLAVESMTVTDKNGQTVTYTFTY